MKRLLLPFVFLFFTLFTHAQELLKSPSEFLGYELGTRFTPHHKVVAYYEHIAATMPNVVSQHYGKTYELRPLMVAMISSQKNMDQLEQIRANNLKRTGLMQGAPSGDKVAIVWLSYNVHGNEANSTETAMKTLYELARPGNVKAQKWLENTLVILDPCVNPDGRDRYANWINQVIGTTPNPGIEAKEHQEPWPGGRPNHYYFDLNRDWAWQKQIESRERMKLYNQWYPHIHVDFHEQGYNSPYYFAPAAEPVHEQVTNWQREFQNTIGRNHANYFDQNSWLFFTKESFDILYPSYGDSYPMYNGAIGMTYEQAGHTYGAVAVETNEGDTLTLKDRIAHHFTTGMSTIEITSQNAEKVVDEFSKYFSDARNNPKARYKTYVVKATNHPDKLKKLVDFLETHEIAYGTASTRKPVAGFHYQTDANESFSVSAGDLVISAYQPKAVLVQALFEPDTYVSTQETYDITAWAVPYMMGLEAYATETRINVSGAYALPARSQVSSTNEQKPTAYLAKWETIEDAKFLSELLKAGIKLRYAEEAFEVGGNHFQPGTLIITRKGNTRMGDRFDQFVEKAAKKYQRNLYATSTGFVDKGKDFGSGNVPFLQAPKILVLRDKGVAYLNFGEIWYFMEQELDYPITMIDTDHFEDIELDSYDLIIFPRGDYGRMLGEETMKGLENWISDGGRVIAIHRAMNIFLDKDGFSLKKYPSEDKKKDAEKETDEEKAKKALTAYKDRNSKYDPYRLPGAIFKLKMDNSHPLAFGYPDHYFTLKNSSSRYAYLPNGWNVGIIENESSHITGVAGDKVKEALSESMIFGVENKGRGAVIYMADNPLFRAFWENGKLLFANAIFMVGQ